MKSVLSTREEGDGEELSLSSMRNDISGQQKKVWGVPSKKGH